MINVDPLVFMIRISAKLENIQKKNIEKEKQRRRMEGETNHDEL